MPLRVHHHQANGSKNMKKMLLGLAAVFALSTVAAPAFAGDDAKADAPAKAEKKKGKSKGKAKAEKTEKKGAE